MSLALVATPAGIKHYEEVFAKATQSLPHVEVVAGNKQVSQKAAQLTLEKDFIVLHMKVRIKVKLLYRLYFYNNFLFSQFFSKSVQSECVF